MWPLWHSHSVGSEPGVWYAQGRLRPRQPPATSLISSLLDTPSGGSGRTSHLRALPSSVVILTLSRHQVQARPGKCGLYGTPTPWDPSQVWWHAQGRLRPRQPSASSQASGLLDSHSTGFQDRVRPKTAACLFFRVAYENDNTDETIVFWYH
ncbi:unnamed protein product [Schistocephalus solidus]|uniref:Uncharacterized protein n=1 Tax=Schistocephalus solidus TaxID=70667 RepID=A0A183TG97_SCHSO|nr:unnamed protein product [Schistocephalus solidus]